MAQHVEPLLRGLQGEHLDFLSDNVSPAPFPEGVVGMLEAVTHDDCHAALIALIRWASLFQYLIQTPVTDLVLRSRLEKMGVENPTEWHRYQKGLKQSTYSLDAYIDPGENCKAHSPDSITKPRFLRGYPVKPVARRTTRISDDPEDHLPYPMTETNKSAPRPIAPIECVPSPQSAFGLKWDCDPKVLSDKLYAFVIALNFDKIESWATSVGLDRDTKEYRNVRTKTGVRLMWRYFNESPVLWGLFSLEQGRDLGFPYAVRII